uniref:BTB domain-containing protein n=1 Tax=Panagrolaimus davidi TaxID=227884 RepID=A0A914P706_9BILA
MSFTLTDRCAKYHFTQITAEIDISKEIVVPYFLHLDQTLLNALKEGEGDSHIIQLPGYEFLNFKCTITKIFDRFEIYIENITYTVAINGNQQSYWTKLNIVNAVSNEWFIEKIDFSFNPNIVWQQFNEMSNRNNLQTFNPTSSTSIVRPSAPIASTNSQQPFNPFPSASYLWRTASPAPPAAASERQEGEQDLEFFDANCYECLNWECERHKQKDSGVKCDEKLIEKFQILDIYDKEKKETVEPQNGITAESLRKAFDELKMTSATQEANLAASNLTNIITDEDFDVFAVLKTNPSLIMTPMEDTVLSLPPFMPHLGTTKVVEPPTETLLLPQASKKSTSLTIQLPKKPTTSPKKPDPLQPSIHKSQKPPKSNAELSQLVSTLEQKQKFLSKILNKTKYSDVILINNKSEQVNGFRCFLAHSSPVLQAIFDSKEELPIRIEVGAFEKETIKQAVYFSQGDLITVNGNAMDLFKFAKKYSMNILMDCCFSSLAQTITIKNVCEYIKFAYDEGNIGLKKKCLEFLKINKLAIDPTAIKQLPQKILFDAFLS